MIEEKKLKDKIKPLKERIDGIYSTYGQSLGNQLVDRISATLGQFFIDFKTASSKSFNFYWKKNEQFKSSLDNSMIKKEDPSDENIPKFINEFNKKNKE